MKEQRNARYNLIKVVLLVVVAAFMFSTPVEAAKLSKTSLTLVKGKTYTLKLKGTKKKATWKTKNKKIAKLSNKKKSSVKIKAVKAGKTTITAKVGKKTYKCKVTVVNKKKAVNSSAKSDSKDSQTSDKKDGQVTDKTSDKTTEQTPEKRKVWIITKWGRTEYTPVYVNKRSQYECTSCGYKTEIGEEYDEHEYQHMLNDEPGGYRVNTIWDSCYYVETEYPEEGYWTEIDADEYPENMYWREDKSYTDGGYYYIDKSGN